MPENLQEEYQALQKIHHQLLHELADAVQIIKSYEFLHQRMKKENKQLRAIVTQIEEIMAAKDFGAFCDNTADLNRSIQEYQTQKHCSADSQMDTALLANANVSASIH